MRVARRRGERSGKREGEEREELEKKEKKEGALAAGSGRIRTWTRPSVEPLQPDCAEETMSATGVATGEEVATGRAQLREREDGGGGWMEESRRREREREGEGSRYFAGDSVLYVRHW